MHDLKVAFDLLGIEPSTDEKIVRQAWRALVRTYHPDMAKTDPAGANKRLAKINAAFDAVSACTAADVALLQKANARAARLAEQRRRERHAARLRARHAAKQQQTSSQRALVVLDDEEQPYRNNALSRNSPRRDASNKGAHPHTAHRGPYNWHITEMAANAFEAARVICAPKRIDAPRSIYL